MHPVEAVRGTRRAHLVRRCSTLIAAALGLACAHAGPMASDAPATPESAAADDALGAAFDEFVRTLRETEAEIRSSPAFGTEAEQVGGYRHLLRSLGTGVTVEVLQDVDYPYFRILDFWTREGGDNPDQRYAFTPIRGGASYRLWGTLGSATRVEFQIYAGRPWDGTGKSAGYLTFEEIALDEDGSFEIQVSPQPPDEGQENWLPNPPDGTTLFARHIYADWDDADPGDIHIDRIGYEGRRRPAESADALAARIRAAAIRFGVSARTWPAFVTARYSEVRDANTVATPYDTYALGGAEGRWMSGGYFELAPGQALVIRAPRTRAKYQGIQLADMWFASLEYANQVSSLTTTQSVLAPDGTYYYVIGPTDPGYANWLDSGALTRGTFLMRWDGVLGELPEAQHPSAQLVDLSQLETAIPGFERVTPEQREAVRRERRKHLQLRYHR